MSNFTIYESSNIKRLTLSKKGIYLNALNNAFLNTREL